MNSLGYESLNEVFFDVFEIKNKDLDLLKEKKGDFNGNPIIELDLRIENEIHKNVRFVLKNQSGIQINPNLLDYTKAVIFEKTKKIKEITKPKKIAETKAVSIQPPKRKIITEQKHIVREEKLIEQGKQEFFESIRNEVISDLKNEIRQGLIADLLKTNIQSNFNEFLEETNTSGRLQKLFQNANNTFRKELIELSEKIARRESMRFAESGGGTTAVQYANGGKMDGDLEVTGSIIAGHISDTQGRELVSKLSFDIIGDGTKSVYTLNHNLGTKNIIINIYDKNTDELVLVSVTHTDTNNTKIDFSNILQINENYIAIMFA